MGEKYRVMRNAVLLKELVRLLGEENVKSV
jgi:hypothetical protein